jgi:phosphate transport system substrate-binding protein
VKLIRAGVAAGAVAGALALAACSSSGGTSTPSSTPAGGNSSASSTSGTANCFSGTLNAEGSSAQNNAVVQWKKDYQTQCKGATVNYNPQGSGDGVTAFINEQVQFAGSDAPLNATQGATKQANKACGSQALNLPMVGGPIALGYKLNGANNLVLDAPTLAKIFAGKITMWNDQAIKALDPSAKLPAVKIAPFFRSDSSGTTYNFESYLHANAKSDFPSMPDTDATNDNWAGQGEDGSSGVAAQTAKTNGGIGYFEYSYAVQESLPTVNIKNSGGTVQVSPDAASKALSGATVVGKGKDLTLQLNYATTASGAYPIDLVTYEIVCSKYPKSSDATKVKDFLSYTVSGGQGSLKQLGYAPLPANLQAKVKASVASIK